MVAVAASCILGALLLTAAVAKLSDRLGTEVALSGFGLPRGAWAVLAAGEAALGAGVLAGSVLAAWAAAGTLVAFALAQSGMLAAGRAGSPCGCFGGRGELGARSLVLSVGGAAGCAALAAGGGHDATWLVLAAPLALAVRPGPRGALEVASEGPPLGEATTLAERLPDAPLRLAVFTSQGCRLCRSLSPALAPFTRERGLAVAFFDEVADADAWRDADIPGSPFVVAVGADGTVLAKGAVNKAEHVASVIAAARDRDRNGPGPFLTRRSWLERAGGAVAALTAGRTIGSLVAPGEAEAYHFCGHIYTTDGCPHPTGLPRIDSRGFPLRARDGRRVDDLGRLVDAELRPLDEEGELLTDPDGRPLPIATRTRVCTAAGKRFRIPVRVDGAWYRCCDGHVRKLVDCCSTHRRRINGDRALRGYCYRNRKVFCVMYFQTRVPC